MGLTNLQLRVVSAVGFGVVTLLATLIGGLPFRILIAATGFAIYYEWVTMHGRPIARGWTWLLAVGLGLIMIGLAIGVSFTLLLGATGLVAILAGILSRFARLSRTAFGGFLYGAIPSIALADLRGDASSGLLTVLFLFLTVWATDIFAYVVGKSVGGPKLAPAISPNKTWSGAIGGTVCATILGFAFASIVIGGPAWIFIFYAIVISIAGQLGDLFESREKRRCGVKDSSNLMPGHGGVLDRVDGLVAAAVVFYAIAVLQAGIGITHEAIFPVGN